MKDMLKNTDGRTHNFLYLAEELSELIWLEARTGDTAHVYFAVKMIN